MPVQSAREAMGGFGMPDFLIRIFSQMYDAVLVGRLDAAEPRTPETTTHTTLASFARKVLIPALQAAGTQQSKA